MPLQVQLNSQHILVFMAKPNLALYSLRDLGRVELGASLKTPITRDSTREIYRSESRVFFTTILVRIYA